MVAGGAAPRYVRLRPRASLSAILDGRSEQALPDGADHLVAKTTVEILTLRPTMSFGLEVVSQKITWNTNRDSLPSLKRDIRFLQYNPMERPKAGRKPKVEIAGEGKTDTKKSESGK
jgi:hypothetical protein